MIVLLVTSVAAFILGMVAMRQWRKVEVQALRERVMELEDDLEEIGALFDGPVDIIKTDDGRIGFLTTGSLTGVMGHCMNGMCGIGYNPRYTPAGPEGQNTTPWNPEAATSEPDESDLAFEDANHRSMVEEGLTFDPHGQDSWEGLDPSGNVVPYPSGIGKREPHLLPFNDGPVS